jgi:hypothetical protein
MSYNGGFFPVFSPSKILVIYIKASFSKQEGEGV